jgi:FkbM family methyltransferase
MHRDLIFDIGMNDGADTAYYLHRGYRVVAVEANPQLAEEARARFRREIAAGRLTVLGVAIAGTAGVLPFWICDSHSPWSSFDYEIASRDGSTCHQIDVECRPFSDILEEHGVPYFLKIDIEGTDHLCIRDLRSGDLPCTCRSSGSAGPKSFSACPSWDIRGSSASVSSLSFRSSGPPLPRSARMGRSLPHSRAVAPLATSPAALPE